jgi:hypothetical protein
VFVLGFHLIRWLTFVHACVCVCVCVYVCMYVCVCVCVYQLARRWGRLRECGEFRLQVPMVGKGVVESMVRVLGAVQGGGAEALAVQKAACNTLFNLATAADNRVRVLVTGRCARAVCGCGLVARGDASAMRMFGWRELCLFSCRFLFHCCCLARRFASV